MKSVYINKIEKIDMLLQEAKALLLKDGVTNRVHDIMIAEISDVCDKDLNKIFYGCNSGGNQNIKVES